MCIFGTERFTLIMHGQIRDSINFIITLTPLKAWNVIRLLWSFYISRWARKFGISGLPAALSIEPTTSCNLRCPQCPSGLRKFTRPTGMMGMDLYKEIIDELSGHLAYLMLYFQGEPFLHPEFLAMVQHAKKRNIYTATSTNGHYLDKKNTEAIVQSGLDRLIISIDGVSQGVYEKYRKGGKVDRVLEGIENLIEAKNKLKSHTPYIIIQFLAFQHNLHELERIREMARRWKVKLTIKTAQVYDVLGDLAMIPANTSFSRYEKVPEGDYVLKNKLYNHCWKMWHSSIITWDGLVVPCCFDKDADHRMGSFARGNFREIWKGPVYQKFREKILTDRKGIDICRNCSEGSKIWI